MILRRALLALSLLAGATLAQDQDDARSEVAPELQARINQAISRGSEALLRQQEIDGSWRQNLEGYRNGQTALALYTLLECDLSRQHPAVARAVTFLRGAPPTRTYSAALQILALAELEPEEHEDWIAAIADELVSWQRGGWGYPDGEVDLSNTQYAALGLRAARRCGARVPDAVWGRLAEWTLEQQEPGDEVAGFRYRPDSDATGSMTSAGVAVLAIAREHMKGRGRALDAPLARGVAWLERYFAIEPNPRRSFGGRATGATDGGHLYYYIYGLERVGALMGTSTFGSHDWYAEGARWLVDKQEADGRWGGQSDTCFALLFLARATSKVRYTGAGATADAATYGSDDPSRDVSLRAAGERRVALWISSFGERALADFTWPGEEGRGLRVVRVDYLAEDEDAEGGVRLLERVPGDPSRPSQGARYAVQIEPARAGRLRVFARVYVLTEGLAPNAPEDELQPLLSQTLALDIARADDPRLDEYARHPSENLLRTARCEARASSQRDDAHKPERAIDGLVGTSWFAQPDDAAPWLELRLSRALRAERVLLTQASADPGAEPRPDAGQPPRIRRVRILLDDERDGYELELDPDPRAKTELDFGRGRKFRTLRVEVLEVEPGVPPDRGVGLAEVELHDRRRR